MNIKNNSFTDAIRLSNHPQIYANEVSKKLKELNSIDHYSVGRKTAVIIDAHKLGLRKTVISINENLRIALKNEIVLSSKKELIEEAQTFFDKLLERAEQAVIDTCKQYNCLPTAEHFRTGLDIHFTPLTLQTYAIINDTIQLLMFFGGDVD